MNQFVSELARVAAPGAAIIIVTWCHRDLLESEESLLPEETNLLNKICNAYYLPSWCSAAEYVKIAKYLSLEVGSLSINNSSQVPWQLVSQECMHLANMHITHYSSPQKYMMHTPIFQEIKTADWSDNVAPFWPAVIQSAFTWRGLTSLLRTGMISTTQAMNYHYSGTCFLCFFPSNFLASIGWKAIKGALVMPLMIEGYKKKLIKFAIITCRKPA